MREFIRAYCTQFIYDDAFSKTRERALVLGYTQISHEVILRVFEEYGFGRAYVDLFTDNRAIKDFDCKNLTGSKYDVIILGQLPMKLNCRNTLILKDVLFHRKLYRNVYIAVNKSRVRITKESLECVLREYLKLSLSK